MGRLVLAAAGGYRTASILGPPALPMVWAVGRGRKKSLAPPLTFVGGSLFGCRAETRRVFQVVDKRFRTLGRQQCQIIQAGIDVALPHLAR